MRIYLAAPWQDRGQMPALAADLEADGHRITERWWDAEANEEDRPYPTDDYDPFFEDRAASDFIGVCRADVMVLMNSRKSEGKAVEMGIALAGNKPVFLIGSRTNLFHYLPGVYLVKNIDDVRRLLQ